jgi:lipopolysaccharide transport system ATP-binding protein
MDEWLSVGDADFVHQAEARMVDFVGGASILVLASHNAQIIDELCNVRVMLEHGQIKDIQRKA